MTNGERRCILDAVGICEATRDQLQEALAKLVDTEEALRKQIGFLDATAVVNRKRAEDTPADIKQAPTLTPEVREALSDLLGAADVLINWLEANTDETDGDFSELPVELHKLRGLHAAHKAVDSLLDKVTP